MTDLLLVGRGIRIPINGVSNSSSCDAVIHRTRPSRNGCPVFGDVHFSLFRSFHKCPGHMFHAIEEPCRQLKRDLMGIEFLAKRPRAGSRLFD